MCSRFKMSADENSSGTFDNGERHRLRSIVKIALELCVGDRVQFMRNDKAVKRVNGQLGR